MKRIGLAVAAAAAWYFYNRNQTRVFRIRTPEISLRKVTAPFRITQITDFHNHKRLDVNEVAAAVAAFDPMCIALTGDLISYTSRDWTPALALAQALVNTGIPVLYVSGNHEYKHPRKQEFLQQLEETGIIRLGGRTLQFPHAELAGIDYPAAETKLPPMTESGLPRILLAHSPTDLKTVDTQADLILCGHTHGGQVRLPGIGAIIVPSQGFFAPVNKGLYTQERKKMYIDSGLGNTRLDLRTFNPIQFTNMVITAHR